jgi:hypothetical protein
MRIFVNSVKPNTLLSHNVNGLLDGLVREPPAPRNFLL